MRQEDILADFPDLRVEHLQAVLSYAADREKRLSDLTNRVIASMAGPLLIDENLSPRLASAMAGFFPSSIHIRDAGLKGAADLEIWSFAQQRGFTIVTKDDDFRGLSLLRGAPTQGAVASCRQYQHSNHFQDSVDQAGCDRVVHQGTQHFTADVALRLRSRAASAPPSHRHRQLRINRHRPFRLRGSWIRQCAGTGTAAWRRRISSDGEDEAHPGVGCVQVAG